MLKKILIVTALSSITTGIAFATPAPYVGGSLGITTNTSSSVASSVNGSNVVANAANFRGVPFSVFGGFGGALDENFYLAGEVFGTFATADISDTNGLKTSYGYGASILPGVMLSDHTLAFARAGFVRTRFSNIGGSTQTGGQMGLGLQTNVTQNVDVRGEYDFTAYRSFNNSIGRVASPRQDSFTLGIVYKFD